MGLMFYLNAFYQALPPMARLPIAQQVRDWADNAVREAESQLNAHSGGPPRPTGPSYFDTTGRG